ncbi:MAG: aromatic amino acid ammonia-lyase [Chloroflexota bacterium]|nr:aromatic amino acid ammonia-lyase [Chloroflexota bacterium]
MSSSHDPMVLRSAADLTLETLDAVAWENRRLMLHPQLLDALATTRAGMLRALADGRHAYGVTTGMGYLATVDLDEEARHTQQANLLLGRAVGGPPFLDHGEARAVLVARLASFLGGQAGVTPDLCGFLVDRLNDDFTPAIPRSGIGCAGEIIPLAHAFGPMSGIGQVLVAHSDDEGDREMAAPLVASAAAALAERGVSPYQPAEKEGIALLAGAPGAVALAAAHLRAVRALSGQLLVAAACAIDAIQAPLSAYTPAVAQLASDPLMAEVLAHLGDLLRSSVRPEGHAPQAPVSFRVIPQVLTHLARTLDRLEEDLRRALAAVTDSPAFVNGQFVTSGGFHAIGLAADLDYLCIALVQAAELAGQHIHRLLDARFTRLPDQLTLMPGPRTGLVVVHKRAVGMLNELRRLASPATVGLADTSMGQEDAMTFTFEAADKLRRAESLLRDLIACELLVCRQVWFLRAFPVASGLEEQAALLAAMIPPIEYDRPLGADIARLSDLLAAGHLTGKHVSESNS